MLANYAQLESTLFDQISVGLVVYRTSVAEIYLLLTSLTKMPGVAVGILDNGGGCAELAEICRVRGWRYMVPGHNLGFGAGHNAIFNFLVDANRPYHLLLNPDIEFEPDALADMLDCLRVHADIGLLMPDVRYPDGARQQLCKLLPTPMDLIARRFLPDSNWKRAAQARYELRAWAHDQTRDIPSLSGCFMLMRSEAFRSVGGFDESFFLYMEDFDLCRRIGQQWRTVYYPQAQVVHRHAKGSYRSKRLLALHIRSAIKYFNKWGWFFDADRKRRNKACLQDLGLLK